jgi:hypothetical protein
LTKLIDIERKNFIRLAGLTTFGLMTNGSLFTSALNSSNHQVIDIKPPNIHVRHGFFNLQIINTNELQIQRDIFNRNGLELISKDRMVSIKRSTARHKIFGVINQNAFKSK